MNSKQFLIIAFSIFGISLSVHAGLFQAALETPGRVVHGAARTTADVATLGATNRTATPNPSVNPQITDSVQTHNPNGNDDWQQEQLEEQETIPPMNLVQGP